MSFQEKAVTTANGDPENEVETPRIAWFRKTFPRFFSEKVVDARKQSLMPPAQKPLSVMKVTEVVVTRKLSEKRTTYATLCKEGKEYLFKLGCGTRLPVPRDALVNATPATAGSEWVRIKIGDEVLRLRRSELRSAFEKLDR